MAHCTFDDDVSFIQHRRIEDSCGEGMATKQFGKSRREVTVPPQKYSTYEVARYGFGQ